MPPRYKPFPELSANICRLVLLSSIEFYWVLDDHANDGPSFNSMKFDSGTEQILSENSITTKHHNSNRLGRFCRLGMDFSPLRWRRLSSLHRLDRHGSYRPPAISSYLQLSMKIMAAVTICDILQTQYLQPTKTRYIFIVSELRKRLLKCLQKSWRPVENPRNPRSLGVLALSHSHKFPPAIATNQVLFVHLLASP